MHVYEYIHHIHTHIYPRPVLLLQLLDGRQLAKRMGMGRRRGVDERRKRRGSVAVLTLSLL